MELIMFSLKTAKIKFWQCLGGRNVCYLRVEALLRPLALRSWRSLLMRKPYWPSLAQTQRSLGEEAVLFCTLMNLIWPPWGYHTSASTKRTISSSKKEEHTYILQQVRTSQIWSPPLSIATTKLVSKILKVKEEEHARYEDTILTFFPRMIGTDLNQEGQIVSLARAVVRHLIVLVLILRSL